MASIDLAFLTLADHPEIHTASLAAIIAANRDDLAPRAVREIGVLVCLRIVSTQFHSSDSDKQRLTNWMSAAVSDSDSEIVGRFLVDQQVSSWAFLMAIAVSIPPDAVPNDHGVDPWLIAVQAAGRSDVNDIPIFLSAYLLSRALGERSRNPGELTQIGFETTYKAARANRLPEDAWKMLQPRLPWSINWFDWDRCPRIRAAATELFIQRDLSPELFAHIVEDDQLFAELVESITYVHRGRQFLERVRRWMVTSDAKGYAKRIQASERHIR